MLYYLVPENKESLIYYKYTVIDAKYKGVKLLTQKSQSTNNMQIYRYSSS